MVRVVDIKEGNSQLQVLSVVAEYQLSSDRDQPIQREIVDKLPLSKGAVSNNCKKLESTGILEKDSEGRYRVNKDETVSVYREFIDPFFVRESAKGIFVDEIEETNQVKTDTMDRLDEVLRENKDPLFDLVLSLLADSRTRKFRNLREVFHRTNHVIATWGRLLEEEGSDRENLKPVLALSRSLDAQYKHLETFTKDKSKVSGLDLVPALIEGRDVKIEKEVR